ncbi:MAG: hypothetical protein O3B65_01595, partial [Chloroflexi bacterium]|nr:hypothetical protein [Chloroflexota bacterium]
MAKVKLTGLAFSIMLAALLGGCSSDPRDGDSTPVPRKTPVATQVAAATAEADASLTPVTPTPVPPTPVPTSSGTRVPPTPTPTAVPSTPTPLPTLDTSQLSTATPSPTPTPPPATTVLNSGPLSRTKIVFTRATPGAQGAELRTVAPDGTGGAVLRSFARSVHNPKWSPDGTLVVAFEANVSDLVGFVILDEAGVVVSTQRQWACVSCELEALWPTETKGTVYVTRDGGLIEHDVNTGSVVGGSVDNFDQLPRLGEISGIDLVDTSATYALSTDMDGNWEIYTGMGRARLTTTVGIDEVDPQWSPDGTQLAFTTTREGNHDVFLIDLETRSYRKITTSTADDIEPTWSPDGKFIAFASNRD